MLVGIDVRAGYRHPAYAASLTHLGSPRHLPGCDGWILVRSIDGSTRQDAIGPYPIFCCRDWARLGEDLERECRDLVAVSLVTDPFAAIDETRLRSWFPDVMRPFKEHFVVDLRQPIDTVLDAHHRRNERKGLASVTCELVSDSAAWADDWVRLYALLSARHEIRGFSAFAPESLVQQMSVPGAVAVRATREGRTVGMAIWYLHHSIGYYHLAAYSAEGYEARASYAIFSTAIRAFAEAGLSWLDLGAGAGLGDSETSGLTRFKRGWSTGTRAVYFCGRILDPDAYAVLLQAASPAAPVFFPAYRAPR